MAYYPDSGAVLQRARELDTDPLLCFAYTALRGRVPTNRTELEMFYNDVNNWLVGVGFPARDDTRKYLLGYIQAKGAFPTSLAVGLAWLVTKGMWVGSTNGYPTGSVPSPGQDYPPGGGSITPNPQPSPNPNPNPSPGGILDGTMNWIRSHPVQAGVAAMAAYILFLSKKRR